MAQPQPVTCRPREHLVVAGRLYPNAWLRVDQLRADRGTHGLPSWPEWCFLPLAGAYAMISEDAGIDRLPFELAADVSRLGALAAWRVTQGIYRFDPAVYDAVRHTTLDRDIPCAVLYRLPEWCVYIETPSIEWSGQPLHGAWAHLEWDVATGRTELRLLTDSDLGLLPIVLHLGSWTIAEAMERALAESTRNAHAAGGSLADLATRMGPQSELVKHMLPVLQPLVALLLYLCSQNAEIGDGTHRPGNPLHKLVRGLPRTFQALRPTTWDVGVRMGAALRRAYHAEQMGQATHAGPRPHVRRAHWHGFWSGPRAGADRRFDLRWLPPIAVNVDDPDALPAVVRTVGGS